MGRDPRRGAARLDEAGTWQGGTRRRRAAGPAAGRAGAGAAAGTAAFLVLAPGVVVGLLPWLITGWRAGHWGPAAAAAGVLLIAAGCGFLLYAFGQFAVEGIGTPAPSAPTEHLVVRGLYRYVRNPMYLAVLAAHRRPGAAARPAGPVRLRRGRRGGGRLLRALVRGTGPDPAVRGRVPRLPAARARVDPGLAVAARRPGGPGAPLARRRGADPRCQRRGVRPVLPGDDRTLSISAGSGSSGGLCPYAIVGLSRLFVCTRDPGAARRVLCDECTCPAVGSLLCPGWSGLLRHRIRHPAARGRAAVLLGRGGSGRAGPAGPGQTVAGEPDRGGGRRRTAGRGPGPGPPRGR